MVFWWNYLDEPEMKATFDISLIHHKKYVGLSNMPVMETRNVGAPEDFVIDTFKTSVKMSTYLVAYSVSDFEYKEAKVDTEEDVVFRIYARRDAMAQVDYAAEVGPKVLKFYEDYFQIKFPLPKIDMIAIPDFAGEWKLFTNCSKKYFKFLTAGAMENWYEIENICKVDKVERKLINLGV